MDNELPPVRKLARRSTVCTLAVFLAAGCATAPDPADKDAVAEFRQINDPIEPFNRAVFSFNRGVDTVILKPLARIYRATPSAFQDGVNNVLANLRAPIVLMNDLLQGEFRRAEQTVGRFVVNSTVGIMGVADVAAEMGVPRHNEDFGQTLAVWGAAEGPYLMLPLLGPSNPRDTVGLAVDFLADPVNLWATNTDRDWILYSRTGMTAIDARARRYEEIDDLERNSLDFYAAVRSLYRQRRADEIGNGKGTANQPVPGISQRPDRLFLEDAPELSSKKE